jgi:Flp pilus assembly protein protease CpaA
MNPFAGWATTVLVIAAAAVDPRSRRIPNRITVLAIASGTVFSLLEN